MSFFDFLRRKPKPAPKMPAALVEVADAEVGVREIKGTNTGARVNEYKAATWMDPTEPWPWCAAFVCWAVREAMRRTQTIQTENFKRPTTPRAYGLEDWSLKQDNSTQTRRHPGEDIRPGDIVIFSFSHCGIAADHPVAGRVEVIEGNTDDAGSRTGGQVMRRLRALHQIRSRIRFTI